MKVLDTIERVVLVVWVVTAAIILSDPARPQPDWLPLPWWAVAAGNLAAAFAIVVRIVRR